MAKKRSHQPQNAPTKPTDGTGPRRDVLPVPSEKFHGRIGATYKDSEAEIPRLFSAPQGAPNVVVILLDDVGFGHPSTFGGPIQTRTLQRLADEGAIYNRFHTTALCSPTRAALLTGRNHHSVHNGTITELATGFPGYDGVLPKDSATIAEILRGNGYSTAAFGKWHNTPDYEISTAGPFDRWPTGLGFEYFWGFHGGEASQWHTPLYENTTPIDPAHAPGWHLSEGMADQAIAWIGQQQAVAPDKPFFMYWAPGAAHAPHHVAAAWADKYKGKFDHGWDKQRELTFENQKRLGVIPPDTKLTPRPDSIPAWDACTADEKRLYARMQEVYAGFLEHVDVQAGKLIDALEAMGVRDNTLVIYIVGDNGPSSEGTLTGTLNSMKAMHGFGDDVARMIDHIDEIGGPEHDNHYPVAWCWAGSSPFQWMKQVASHFGGTRNPMVMSWPGHIENPGTVRSQFHHVIDIAPTILEVAGVPEPREVNGVGQRPIEGVSMTYTWTDARAPGRRTTQYFEMFGNRAIYHEGWVAGCRHGRVPWETGTTAPFDSDTWELYDIERDFSQAEDLAERDPKRLRAMQDLFVAEAAKYNVLPLDDRFAERGDATLRPSRLQGKTRFVYLPGTVRIPEPSAPNTKNVDHVIAAEIEISDGAEGVLACCGGETGGWTLFVKDGHLHWEHNWFRETRFKVVSEAPLPAGHHIVSADVHVDKENAPGTGGNVVLRVDEQVVGQGRFDTQVPYRFTVGETFDVGCDTLTPVSDEYESPFPFTGELARVMLDVSEASFDELASEVKVKLGLAIQ
jgi:arylsulfatase A-like enzyme